MQLELYSCDLLRLCFHCLFVTVTLRYLYNYNQLGKCCQIKLYKTL